MIPLSDIIARRKPVCPRGHEKSVVGVTRWGCCVACARARAKKWQQANRAKCAEAHRSWRARHPGYRSPVSLDSRIKDSWRSYRRGARLRGYDFALDERLFRDLVTDNCYYCGAAPTPVNGVDRVDNDRGYFDDNVVTACKFCQNGKREFPRHIFEEWVARAAAHQAKWSR